nr:carbon-nitrogen hydrolase family protein [Halothermothrix orenii]
MEITRKKTWKKGERACRKAREKEADIALFPEMWKEFDGSPRNSFSLIDRKGEIIFTYAKVHTCDFSLEAACTPGEDFYVGELDTKKGMVKIGAMICYDREFPESARILMLKGAEIILVPNACDMNEIRTDQLKTRAYENMLGIALANYPGHGGKSVAFDGMAYSKEGKTRDMVVIKAVKKEGIYIAEFNMDELRNYRERESWGNAFRKPGTYDMLTSFKVEKPFIRKYARR